MVRAPAWLISWNASSACPRPPPPPQSGARRTAQAMRRLRPRSLPPFLLSRMRNTFSSPLSLNAVDHRGAALPPYTRRHFLLVSTRVPTPPPHRLLPPGPGPHLGLLGGSLDGPDQVRIHLVLVHVHLPPAGGGGRGCVGRAQSRAALSIRAVAQWPGPAAASDLLCSRRGGGARAPASGWGRCGTLC